jgi:hypothetical protein
MVEAEMAKGSTEFWTAALLHGQRVEWTVLRQRKTGVEVVSQDAVTLPEGEDVAAQAAALKAAMGGSIKGVLTVVVPTEHVLLRTADLPATEADELAGMVELQVDKFSPFPIDQMAISYEPLRQQDDSTRVLIAACKQELVEQAGALFGAAGRVPDRVDVAATAWWALMARAEALPGDGRQGLLLVDETGAELVIAQDGVPVLIRSLGAQHDQSDEDYAEELAEETGYTLTSIESEWGGSPLGSLTVWHRGRLSGVLVERIEAECGLPVQSRNLDELPPLSEGAVRRDVEGGGDSSRAVLDLALPEWKTAAAQSERTQRLVWIGASVAAVWVAALVTIFVVTGFEQRQLGRLQEEVRALRGPADAAGELRRRVQSLEDYTDRTHSVLECLLEVTQALPVGVELNAFTYRKGDEVNLRGESPRVPPIYDFFEKMEASSFFAEAIPGNVTQTTGGRRQPDFRITLKLPGWEERQP